MKKKIYLLCFFCINALNAQTYELGGFIGGSNYVGDVGNTTYVNPSKIAYGILYKWNRSPRHSFRFSYTQSEITANDNDSKEPSRKLRGFRFDNSLKEFSAGIEFNFFEFDLHTSQKHLTPYVYSGINYFSYDKLYIVNNETKNHDNSRSLAIPFILGIKATITTHFILALEVGTRYTFTDNIDGSNPKEDLLAPSRFGNLNNNDWYMFSGVTLTYTFGKIPCFCPF